MLELRDIQSGYGETRVLHGLSLTARAGRVLAVLGRNGAGKSTTLKTIMGLLPATAGSITLAGRALPRRPYEVAAQGIAYVPETRDIFPSLSVRENLEIAAGRFPVPEGAAPWTLHPRLAFQPFRAKTLIQQARAAMNQVATDSGARRAPARSPSSRRSPSHCCAQKPRP